MTEKITTVTRIAPVVHMKKLKRVAAYARVSSGKDAMLHSLAAQVSYYSDLIQRNPEWEYVGVYADEGLSGTKESRPEFQRMLNDCRDGKIDRIMCKSISRFARNTIVLLETVRELKGLGVGLYFEEQNIDTMSGDGEFMLSILASFAQEESRNVSENSKWRVRKKFEQGIPTGFGLYGYQVKCGSFTVAPEEADIVRGIFSMFLEGMGRAKILKTLNTEEIPAPGGGLWTANTVTGILCNEKYAGDLLLQKYFINNHIEKKECVNRGEMPQYYVAEDHEPIISREVFDAVQEEIKRRAGKYVNGCEQRVAQANGVVAEKAGYGVEGGDCIFCGICGKKYRRKTVRAGTPYASRIWICRKNNLYGNAYCSAKQIPEKILNELIVSVLE